MKTILHFALAAILLPMIGWSGLLLVSTLPVEPIRQHVEMSLPESVGGPNPHSTLLSGFTDCIMENIALSNTEAGAVEYSLRNLHYCSIADEKNYRQNPGRYLVKAIRGDTQDLDFISYGRYWHGYLVLLRPLMSIMEYDQVIFVNIILLNTLFVAFIGLIWRRLGVKIAACFCIGFLAIDAPFMACRFQTTDILTITYLASIAILLLYDRCFVKLTSQALFFFCIGCATSYFDFLTIPVVTLGIPLLLLMLLYREECNRQRLWAVIVLSLAWGSGYAWMWMSKWILVEIFTSQSIFAEVLEQIHLRTLGHGEVGWLWSRFKLCKLVLGFGGIAAVIVATLLCASSIKKLCVDFWLFLIIAMPLVWTVLLMEHTIVHRGVTYRMYSVAVIAWLVLLLRNTSLSHLAERLGLKKSRRQTDDEAKHTAATN